MEGSSRFFLLVLATVAILSMTTEALPKPMMADAAKGYPKGPCTPLEEKKYLCNTCTCSDNGKDYICTKSVCPPVVDGKCVPGTRWMDDCNNCGCSDTGIPFCTLKGCMSVPTIHVPKE